jgi:hypothetical protein
MCGRLEPARRLLLQFAQLPLEIQPFTCLFRFS